MIPGALAGPGSESTWHHLLLRMAGTVPDELICAARTWLAESLTADVAQALAFAAVAARVPVLETDAALIVGELLAAGEDVAVAERLEVIDASVIRLPAWVFSPIRIEERREYDAPSLLDLSTDPADTARLDDTDRAAVAAARREPAVLALWRSWRVPADGSPWPLPRRVFIVEARAGGSDRLTGPGTRPDSTLPALTSRLQAALTAAGEVDPQVEVCRVQQPVPSYQSTARAHSALLWAAEPARPIRLARVFDTVDPQQGPSFDPAHPVIEELEEVQRLLTYLDAGLPVLTTTTTMFDVVDPEQLDVVPLTFRTDGEWIWTDAVSYYLARYWLAPEGGLLAHLRSAPPVPPPVSDVAQHRALAFLQRPDESEPIWVVPQMSGPQGRPTPV